MDSKSNSKIETITIPPISLDFLEKLERAFVNQPVKDTDTLIKIGRNAGRQEVINFIQQHVRTRRVSGNPDDLVRPQRLSFLQRLLNR